MDCPDCGYKMEDFGPDHFHCRCGRCVWEGFELMWKSPTAFPDVEDR